MYIDPGLSGTGYAIWTWEAGGGRMTPPLTCGVLTAPSKKSWDDRVQWYFIELCELYIHNKCWGTIVEWPNYRPTMMGQMVAARGDLGKLFAISTVCLSVGWSNNGFGSPISVNKWKGQLSKEIVRKRIEKRIGLVAVDGSKIESHAVDAVGIGLYWKGCF